MFRTRRHSHPAGRQVWDLLGLLPDFATEQYPEPGPVAYLRQAELGGKPVVFMRISTSAYAATAFALAGVTTVVAQLHCVPSLSGIRRRIGDLIPEGAASFDGVFCAIIEGSFEASSGR